MHEYTPKDEPKPAEANTDDGSTAAGAPQLPGSDEFDVSHGFV